MKSKNKNTYGWFTNYGPDDTIIFGKLYGFNGGTLYFPDTPEGKWKLPFTGFGAYQIFDEVKKSDVNKLLKYIKEHHNESNNIQEPEPEGILYNMDSTGNIITNFVWTNYIIKSKRTGYKHILYLKESELRNILN